MKSWPSFQIHAKEWSARNLRKPLASARKSNGQLPAPPTFVPRATDELPGEVSTSGHCHWGEAIDTIFAPCLRVEQSLQPISSYCNFAPGLGDESGADVFPTEIVELLA